MSRNQLHITSQLLQYDWTNIFNSAKVPILHLILQAARPCNSWATLPAATESPGKPIYHSRPFAWQHWSCSSANTCQRCTSNHCSATARWRCVKSLVLRSWSPIPLTDNTLGIICINIVIHALDIASGRQPVARPQSPIRNVQQNQDDGIIEGT